MTATLETTPSPSAPSVQATKPTVLMCRPEHFTVSYRINPWMHPEDPTDTSLALKQWTVLYDTYVDLGFTVHLIDSLPGLPDMVQPINRERLGANARYAAQMKSQKLTSSTLRQSALTCTEHRFH